MLHINTSTYFRFPNLKEIITASVDIQRLVMVEFHFGLQRGVEDVAGEHGFEELGGEFLLDAGEDEVAAVLVADVAES